MLNGLLMDLLKGLLINTSSDLIPSQVKGSLHHWSIPYTSSSEAEHWEATELGTPHHLCVLQCLQALQASREKPRATKGDLPKVSRQLLMCVQSSYQWSR